MWTFFFFKHPCLISYSTASILCFGFLAANVGSWFPDQGLNLHPLPWKAKSYPLDCHVQLFATPRNVARQAPLSMGFPRQEY